MRCTQYLVSTQKETPADAEIISHQLMLRAGLIRKLAAGLYTWLPMGLRVLRKVEAIVREEMNNAGAMEVLMPSIQPAELWEETGRWQKFGPELLRITDRHDRSFCYGPTHEEVITDLIRNEIRSYKQLPANFYQIQTKFRDETRPRFGVMRAREFLMKDAYSFHLTDASLDETYQRMHLAYSNIFRRMGLDFRAVRADSGAIGGALSHEFHVLAASGEDAIAFSNESEYAANIEAAECLPSSAKRPDATRSLEIVDTANQHSIEEVSKFLNCPPSQCLKTLLVKGEQDAVVALVLRGDHTLNEVKAQNHALVFSPLTLATDAEILLAARCNAGSIGPRGLTIPIIADHASLVLADFVCGANENGKHLTGANWERDIPLPITADLRSVQEGDPSPDGKGTIDIKRGIEVGHIFKLGKRYSESMKASVQDENSQNQTMIMGCYGIGVSRVVAAAIEQNNDEKGIIWPSAIAPFQVALLPMNMQKSVRLTEASGKLYEQLIDAGIEVLFDDRPIRPGNMFADMELIGIPHRVVLGDKGLDKAEVEYKGRRDTENQFVPLDGIIEFLREKISSG